MCMVETITQHVEETVMKLWEMWIVPIFYRRFWKSPDGRFYWIFRVDLIKRYPFVLIQCYKYENKMWDINQLLDQLLMQLQVQFG